MANTIQLKRRVSGVAGAPSALKSGEIAHNEVDDTLYIGKGDDGAGNATSIIPLAGRGGFLDLTTGQTVAGTKTFSLAPKSSQDASDATDLVRKSQLDAGLATKAALSHSHAISDVTGLQSALDTKAPIASPGLTGTPTAPTAGADTNTTQLATTAFVLGQAGTSAPSMNGSAAIGTSTRFARADHVHPTDTSRAPLASPALTGTPTAPTPANGTNTTQIATTAFVRATRLDQLAAPAVDLALGGYRLTGLGDPQGAQDAVTKAYVDLTVQGLEPKQSVRAASTANIATLSGPMTLDGVALVAGDRVLVKDQTTAGQNGIYVVAAGAWTRSADADVWGELISAYVFVESGTTNADMGYLATVDPGGALGTTAITFVQFTGAGQILAGAGLTKSGNTLDVGAGTGIAVAADTVGLTGQALALHTLATNGMVARTAAATVAARSIAVSGAGLSVTNGDAVAGNPTLGLTAALASVGNLTPAADRLAYYTGASAAALANLTAFARSLLDDADAATARATLGLGTLATQSSASVSITGGSIDGVALDGGTF
ncbi:MAG: hypothetical protein RIT52_1075 [Pseudomonadota bacterium]|jgi:hypothetical protein